MRAIALMIAGLLAACATQAEAQDGASIFNRCAACHTRTGAGVPGAYPPLNADFRALAAKPGGRSYLALAVIKGLNGPIMVEGKPYRGMMPAQGGLNDAGVAAVLNHVGGTIAKVGPAFRPFTDTEVAGYRASGKALTSADVARLHEGSGGK